MLFRSIPIYAIGLAWPEVFGGTLSIWSHGAMLLGMLALMVVQRDMYMGHGLYWAGATACSDKARPDWMGCDKNLRAALPFMNDEATLRGQTLFFLGLANYNIFKLTTDRTKLNDAVKFSEQSAALSHPMQGQAATNAQAMKREAAAPAGRGR